jgi:uncharacterized membrane protein HdeD (DUF308 family)
VILAKDIASWFWDASMQLERIRVEIGARRIINILWWVLLVRGLAALVFGVTAVFWPSLTLTILVYLFSSYIIVSGILGVVLGIFSAGRSRMWLLGLLIGVLELAVGIFAVRNPNIALGAFLLLVGFTFTIRGILQIVSAFMEAPPDRASRALLIIGGALSTVAGLFILLQPATGGLAFVWALGAYLLIVGSMDVARAAAAKALIDELTIPVRSRG